MPHYQFNTTADLTPEGRATVRAAIAAHRQYLAAKRRARAEHNVREYLRTVNNVTVLGARKGRSTVIAMPHD